MDSSIFVFRLRALPCICFVCDSVEKKNLFIFFNLCVEHTTFVQKLCKSKLFLLRSACMTKIWREKTIHISKVWKKWTRKKWERKKDCLFYSSCMLCVHLTYKKHSWMWYDEIMKHPLVCLCSCTIHFKKHEMLTWKCNGWLVQLTRRKKWWITLKRKEACKICSS